MKRRSFFNLLAAGVVVLLLTGIGGYYWLVRDSPLNLFQGGQTIPKAAMFVPKQAPVMASMLVNPNRLEALGLLVTLPGQRRQARTELNKLKTSLLANTSLDYRRDIQPWIGDEITVAVTTVDIDRDEQNGRQPGYLMALATRDGDKSREFLQVLFSKRAIAGSDLVIEQYKGVKLIYDNQRPQLNQNGVAPSPTNQAVLLSSAVVGDRFVLVANHPKVLREAINNVQAPDLSLISSSQYQQALTLLPPRRIGLAFLNLPNSKKYDQLISLELNRRGLLAETTLLASPDQEIAPPPPTLTQVVGALQYIPSATSLSISGLDLSHLGNTDFNQLWAQVLADISGLGYNSELINQPLADLEAQWGIDLKKDVFSWVQGEYALGLLPNTDQTAPNWIFVAEKSDEAVAGISRLDAIASKQGLSLSSLPVGNQKITAWTQLTNVSANSSDSDQASITLKAKVQGVHATVGKYEIFTTSVEAMNEAFKAPQIGSLVDNPKFQASIDAIPRPNQGYVYLDWKTSQGILERRLPILKLLEVPGKPFFSNLQSLTISSYSSDAVLKGGVFLKLKR